MVRGVARERIILGRPFTGRHGQPEYRPPQPFADGVAHRLRRGGGIEGKVLLIFAGVIGINCAFGQGHRLAAEAADLFQPADRAGKLTCRRALDLVGGGTLGQVIGQQLVEASADGDGVLSRLHIDGDFRDRQLFERLDAGLDADGHFLVAHQYIVEARGFEAAEYRHREVELWEVSRIDARHDPVAVEPGRSDIVVHQLFDWPVERWHGGVHILWRRTGRDVAEPFFDLRPGGGYVDIPCQHQHGIVRAVVGLEPVLHIGKAGGIQVRHRSDGRVAIGVAFGQHGGELGIFDQTIGLILAHPLFILHDAALGIELGLRHRAEQVTHAIGFQEQCPV